MTKCYLPYWFVLGRVQFIFLTLILTGKLEQWVMHMLGIHMLVEKYFVMVYDMVDRSWTPLEIHSMSLIDVQVKVHEVVTYFWASPVWPCVIIKWN